MVILLVLLLDTYIADFQAFHAWCLETKEFMGKFPPAPLRIHT